MGVELQVGDVDIKLVFQLLYRREKYGDKNNRELIFLNFDNRDICLRKIRRQRRYGEQYKVVRDEVEGKDSISVFEQILKVGR